MMVAMRRTGAEGSSPLARGLLPLNIFACFCNRIIPARAGFTVYVLPFLAHRPDHPRSRGVYPVPSLSTGRGSGSSPLARGLLCVCALCVACCRIIPARAGFTHVAMCVREDDGDHPRSRGVYSSASGKEYSPSGSSPLARGLHTRREANDTAARIIPARAGFTAH